MKTKTLLALLAFVLCVALLAALPFTASAEDVTLQASGTENDPYIVTNADELAAAMLGNDVFIKLGKDFEVLTDIVVSKNLAIDLNGHELTISSKTGILVQDSGLLEIADLTEGGNGKIYNKLNVTPNTTITNYGKLYISSGIIDAFGTYSVENYGIFEMFGGEITDAIYNYGTGTLAIHNGTVYGTAFAIANAGTMTVTGGTINGGSQYGIFNGEMFVETEATLTVTGGTISGGDYGIVNFANATLSGGNLVNGILSDTCADSLAEGYAFLDESCNPIALEAGQTTIKANIIVGLCNAHIGGTATCTAKANCAACGTAYGELAAHNFGETDVCVLCKAVNISEKTFPDEIFRTYIKDNFDKDVDGVLSAKEIANVIELNILSKGIVTLQGIEYFTSLDHLVCGYNYLTSLDVSNCTALTSLYCQNNQLISLDVSGCTALAALYCQNNQLISLDVSDCIALIELSCHNNRLTNLDLTNTNITSFISSSQSVNITIDQKTMSYTMPEGFDATKVINVTGGSFNSDVLTVNEGAETVTYEYKTNNGDYVLTVTLIVDNSHTHTYVENADEAFFKSPATCVSGAIYYKSCSCTKAGTETFEYGAPTPTAHDFGETDVCVLCKAVKISEKTFPDEIFRTYIKNNFDIDEDGVFSVEEIASVDGIILMEKGVVNLDGIKYFTSLTVLNCANTGLTSLDVSGLASLTSLSVDGSTELTSLNVSGCTSLIELYCHVTGLTSLDVSDCTSLTVLYCEQTALTSLDLSANTNITTFSGANQQVNITINPNATYTMPAGFDAAKATNVTGGSFNGNVLTVNDGAETVTYDYKTDNGDYALTVTLTIKPHTHDFGENGVCTLCGVKGAEASQVSLTLGGDIGINFYWTLDSSVIGDASAYFLVTLPNGNTKKIMVADAPMGTPVGSNKEYYKITGLVAAKEMAEAIKVDLYAGGEVIASAECSVRDYAKRVFEYDASNTELVLMIEAMLNYGAASQMLFKHNTDDLANNIVEWFVTTFTPDDLDTAKLSGSVTGVTPTSFSCILETKTTLRHYFTIDSGSVADYTFKVDDTEVKPKLVSGNTYYVDIENISATDMDRMYDFTITNGEETLTITASVICYMCSVIVNKDNVALVSPELLKVAHTACDYWFKAENYFESN